MGMDIGKGPSQEQLDRLAQAVKREQPATQFAVPPDRRLFEAQLSFVRQGGETKRYHTVPTLREDTVAAHSFGVAWLAMLLAQDYPGGVDLGAVAWATLAHDLAEHKAGDMPSPAKRAMGIREKFGTYEDELLRAVELNYVLMPEEQRILTFADNADGALFCCRERAMGNATIGDVYGNFRAYLAELNPTKPRELWLCSFIDRLWSKYNG